jgi:hypothetical protein
VKAVPLEDSLLIMRAIKGGPPPEKTVTLVGLIIPKLVTTLALHRMLASFLVDCVVVLGFARIGWGLIAECALVEFLTDWQLR